MSKETRQKPKQVENHEYKDRPTNIQIIKNAREFVLPFAKNYTGFEYYKNKLKEEYEVFQQRLSQLIQIAIFENVNTNEHRELRLLAKEWKNFETWSIGTDLNQKDRENLQNIITELIRLTHIFVQKQIAGSKGLPTLNEETLADLLNSSESNLDLSDNEVSFAQTTIEEALGMEIEQIVALYNAIMETDLSFEEMLIEMLKQFDKNLDFKNNIKMQTPKYFAELF